MIINPKKLTSDKIIDFGITNREEDILKILVQGHSQKVMARILGISPYTVNDHLKSIYKKLGVNSRSELHCKIDTLSNF